MYGLRLLGPVAIGMSAVSAWRFVVLNTIGAAIWAVAVAGAGYLFGHAIAWFLADLEVLEKAALVCVVAVAVVLFMVRRHRARA